MEPFTFWDMVLNGMRFVVIAFGGHILLAAWALSRIRKSPMNESARALWTLISVAVPYAGPSVFLLQSYRTT